MRKFMINVNGNSYEVEVEEVTGGASVSTTKAAPVAAAQPVASTPKAAPAPKVEKKEVVVSQGQEVIEAPMPGNIWKIVVSEGDQVKSGDVLLILEAMKMENEIVAPRDGIVASINTTTGASVNTGEKLVVLD